MSKTAPANRGGLFQFSFGIPASTVRIPFRKRFPPCVEKGLHFTLLSCFLTDRVRALGRIALVLFGKL